MSKIIEKPYDVMILMTAKIIHDLKLNESEWESLIFGMSTIFKNDINVKNINYAKKIIKDQLIEVEGEFFKKYSNTLKSMPDFLKCYCKLVDWILQINLKRERLLKSKYKKTVAKHILTEEMLVANKFFKNQEAVKSFNLDKIIDISIKNYIK